MINHSGSAISLKIFIFLKNNLIQDTSREARIVSAPAALICPESTRGKDPWSFSPRGSPFSFTTRPAKTKRNARNHRRTQKNKTQKKRTQRQKHAIRSDKGRSAKRRTQRPQKARTLSKILLLSPKWGPPIDFKIIAFWCDKIPGWEGGDGSEKYPPNRFHLLTE